jgi:hypothetical protein
MDLAGVRWLGKFSGLLWFGQECPLCTSVQTGRNPCQHNDSYKHQITDRRLLWFKCQFALPRIQTGFRRPSSLLRS